MLWVLLFLGIAVGGALLIGFLVLRLWRSARALLGEVDATGRLAGELADLLAQVEIPRTGLRDTFGETSDDAWPGTVETYDDAGAMSERDAPGKKDS